VQYLIHGDYLVQQQPRRVRACTARKVIAAGQAA
jgi:hypothetical protein